MAGKRLAKQVNQADFDRWVVPWHHKLMTIMNVELELEGELPAGPAMLVSNHVSWLDPLVIGSLTPVSVLAKEDIRSWPVLGALTRAGQAVYIRRGRHHTQRATQQLNELLSQGRKVMFYPEATTSDGTELFFFFPRLFAAARQQQVAVQPVAMSYPLDREESVAAYIDQVAFLPHFWRVLRSQRIIVRVQLLEPLDATNIARRELAERSKLAIANALALPVSARQLATQGRAAIQHLRRLVPRQPRS